MALRLIMAFQWDNRHPKRESNENLIDRQLLKLIRCLFVSFLLSATGSYCVKDSNPPFCPKNENEIGDKRCCLEAPEWNELI